jgi:hypothetical protein
MNARAFAESTLQLLQQDPRRYRNFGPYWWFVKALLKQFYTRDNLHLLGDYEEPDALTRMAPEATTSLDAALQAAVEEYRQNATYNLGRTTVTDANGEVYTLSDPDAGLS